MKGLLIWQKGTMNISMALNDIFVDTWAWLALSNRNDAYHERAKDGYEEIKSGGYRMVTSDYVLDEVITALFRNVAFSTAVRFVESLFSLIKNKELKLERVNEAKFKAAWSLRKAYRDKPEISFTDMTSFALMQELGIKKVFTGDVHFEKVGLKFEILPK